MDLTYVLKRPLVTEKSTLSLSKGKYTFEVDRQATKKEITKAVEDTFGVHVKGVKTIRIKTLQSDWKKAIVQLAEGEKIDIFETGE